MNPYRITTALLCAAAFFSSTGCIVGDIHEEMVAMNETMTRIEVELREVKKTNQSLEHLQEQLKTLETMDEALQLLDEHLASLRNTLDNIDSTIPFLSLSDEDGDADTTDTDGATENDTHN